MIKVEIKKLTGAELDWAVAKCEGFIDDHNSWLHEATVTEVAEGSYHPSVNWAQGGPIIQKECITLSALYAQKNPPSSDYAHGEWGAYIPCGISSEASDSGPTPLIAAMRCYVASKIGRLSDDEQ